MPRITRWLLTLSVTLVALFATFGSAAAAAPTPPTNAQLEQAYKVEQQSLRLMQSRFEQARKYTDEVAALITKLKNQGINTAPLERALAAFRARIVTAKRQWQVAHDVLATHAGFDAQGHVTDAKQASATVAKAHIHLVQARIIVDGATTQLRLAAAAFLRAHHP
jgi:hypothetical protein